MPPVIASVPTSFDLRPHAGRWYLWSDINACFWPGPGKRAATVNLELANSRGLGGVYLFAWSEQQPVILASTLAAIRYIGETSNFKRRMGQFGNSAGFWGKRAKGHSAGWRWPEGQTQKTWVAFFPVGNDLQPHLATGLRRWMEAVAQEEYRLAHGSLPEINAATSKVDAFA